MRTKSLFVTTTLTAAFLVASQQQGHAQVGYVNVIFRPGLELVANPLYNSGNNANIIMPYAPDGTVLYRFDPNTQYYMDAATYVTGVGWYPVSGNTNDPALALNPGEGFFVRSLTRWTNTFIGGVLHGWLTNPIPPNYSLKASLVPIAGLVQTDLHFTAVADDTIWRWDSTNQQFTAQSPYHYSGGWDPLEPSLNIPESFVLHRDPDLATPDNWWIWQFIFPFAPAADRLAATDPTAPEIHRLSIAAGTVTLRIINPTGQPYDLQFSIDGRSWETVARGQTGVIWTGPCPGSAQGYYQVVKP
jgi:hypothetical protein